jgi:imipenem/basic amino acid-specific outer membrane pore
VGRMELIAPLLNDPDYRATPTTTQGFSLRTEHKGVIGYLAGSDKGSAYTDPEFGSYTDDRGESFNIYTAGLEFEAANALYIHGAFGQADNVMDQVYFNALYPWEINKNLRFLVDAYHYSGRANGEGALLDIGPDYRSSLSNIALRVIGDSSVLTFSLQTVNGDHYRTSWDGERNDNTSYFSWQSVQRLNFDRANEDSWQLRFDYDFKNMARGLHVMARYISGDNIRRHDGLTGSEWERDIDFIYQPPGIRNLTLRWRNAVVRSTETFDSNENRLIVNYSLQAF